jgi:simple sugar transport system ATP-binding protein
VIKCGLPDEENKMNKLLEVDQVSKRFGTLIANNNISFSIGKGKVLAVLGENGAGKTTLMNIIFGHYLPDKGYIRLKGTTMRSGDTKAAISSGIGMVHQHFTLAENLTVLENILIGRNPLWGWKLNSKVAEKKILEISERFGLKINPLARVSDLSVGEKQRLEIVKTLYADSDLVILDEPTASLTPQEVDTLFITIESMVKSGLSVIIISHKLDEILRISDNILVLRQGKVVANMRREEATRTSLAELIVGRKIEAPNQKSNASTSLMVNLINISTKPSQGSPMGLKEVNLNLMGGEIHGIAGVAGNGQRALCELIAGHITPKGGLFKYKGVPLDIFNVKNFMEMGIAYIPEDRNIDGVISEMTIKENIILSELNNPKIASKLGIFQSDECEIYAKNICRKYDVRMQSISQPARLLSGGNVQKLLIGRWLERNPNVIIACQPTRGLDEGAIAAVHSMLLAAKSTGKAVLFVTEDLDELLLISDQVSVMFNGSLTSPKHAKNLEKREIGLMMTGTNYDTVKG